MIAEGPPSVLDTDARVAEVYLGGAVSARHAGADAAGGRPGDVTGARRSTRNLVTQVLDIENVGDQITSEDVSWSR